MTDIEKLTDVELDVMLGWANSVVPDLAKVVGEALAERLARERARCADAIKVWVDEYSARAGAEGGQERDELGRPVGAPTWTPNMDGTWSGLQLAEAIVRRLGPVSREEPPRG